jgi:hypothetical protein
MSLEISHNHFKSILSAPWVLAELSLGVNEGVIEVLTSCCQNTNRMQLHLSFKGMKKILTLVTENTVIL